MIKNLVLTALLGSIFVLVWMLFTDRSPSLSFFEPDIPEQANPVIRSTEEITFDELYKAKKPYSELAVPGSITIIEVRTNTCSICAGLEKKLPAFQKARPDVLVYQVNLPDEGVARHFATKEEADKWMKEREEKFDMYNFGGTPHIEIYGADGNLIIADKGRSKKGLEFLEKWIDSEI
ncbi:MAG: hypothetical protein RLN81_05650 [Balneolaceae bacterium]